MNGPAKPAQARRIFAQHLLFLRMASTRAPKDLSLTNGTRGSSPAYASPQGVAGAVHHWSLVALAFCIPLLYPLQNACIIVAGAAWLFSGQAGDTRRRLRERSMVVWWLLFLGWHIVSLLWSANGTEGLGDVTRKSSFLLMPLLVGAAWRVDRVLLERCYTAFVLGVLAAGLSGFAAALVAPAEPGPQAYFYDYLVRFVDDIAVSAAWKCLLALLILLLHDFEDTLFRKAGWRRAAFLLLIAYLILLSAKTLLVLGIGITLTILLFRVILKRKERPANAIALLAIPLALYCAWSIPESPLRKRFKDVSNAAVAGLHSGTDIRHADNYNKRMAVWTAAWQNLQAGNTWIFGTGIGDLQAAQDQRVRNPDFAYNSYANLYELHDYKVDNMYLQTWLGLGVPGLLCLGALLLAAFAGAVRKRLAVPAVFVAASALFFFQESVLQSQTGIVTATFFTCLWAAHYRLRLNPFALVVYQKPLATEG